MQTTVDALEVLAAALDRTGGDVVLDRLSAVLILSELSDLRSLLCTLQDNDERAAALASALETAASYQALCEGALDETHRLRQMLAEARRALADWTCTCRGAQSPLPGFGGR